MTALAYKHPDGSAVAQRRQDWETPPELFARYDAIYGFTLDVCATAENAKVAQHFTPDHDALSRSWDGAVCWMNPPYGREIGRWMEKAYRESLLGATVVCLVPARTDTAWWHDFAAKGEVEFLRGRVAFIGEAKTGHNAPFPCAIVVFRTAPTERREPSV